MINKLNTDLIRTFFNDFIYVKNHCAEVRCFDSQVHFRTNRIIRQQKTIVTGWFTSADELVCELQRLDGVSAYITVNPVSLARRPIEARNCLRNYSKGFCCDDQDITVFRYLIIDIDPPRQENVRVNSTEQELLSCIKLRNQILDKEGLSYCSLPGISGNGAFILVHLKDCEMGEELNQDVEEFSKYLSDKYKNNSCKVDANTRNPSRHLPIPGTWKFRDPIATQLRPHRQVTIDLEARDAGAIRHQEMGDGSSRSTSF